VTAAAAGTVGNGGFGHRPGVGQKGVSTSQGEHRNALELVSLCEVRYDATDPITFEQRGTNSAQVGMLWERESESILFRENWLSELLVHYTVSPAWWRRDGRRRICDLPRHPAGQTKGHS